MAPIAVVEEACGWVLLTREVPAAELLAREHHGRCQVHPDAPHVEDRPERIDLHAIVGVLVGWRPDPVAVDRQFLGTRDALDDRLARFLDDRPWQAADVIEFTHRFGLGARHVEQGSIGQQRAWRHVFRAGEFVPQHDELAQDRHHARAQVHAPARTADLTLGVEGLTGLDLEFALVPGPVDPPEFREPFMHALPHERQVAHVVGGVTDLACGQRACIPVREGVPLRKAMPGERLDRVRQACRPRHAHERCPDLRIHHVARERARGTLGCVHVLAAGVHERDEPLIADRRPDPRKIRRLRRIDDRHALRRRDLHQADARVEVLLADELGVVREGPGRSEVFDEFRQLGRGLHDRRVALRHHRVLHDPDLRGCLVGVGLGMVDGALSAAEVHEGWNVRGSGACG